MLCQSPGTGAGYVPIPNCANTTCASHVTALRPVSNASSGPTSALSAWLPMLLGLLVNFPWNVPLFPRLLRSVGSISQPSQTSVRLELIHGGLQFSAAGGYRLCQTDIASTAGIYDCKWGVYEGWCRTEQISPLKATVQQLAGVPVLNLQACSFHYLIQCYRSAISTGFRLQGGWNLGTNPILFLLLHAFHIKVTQDCSSVEFGFVPSSLS